MKRRTWAYLLLVSSLLSPASAGLARASGETQPLHVDVDAVSCALLTFDVIVAGAEQAAQADAAASRQLAHNGLHVAERPMGLSAPKARALWRAVRGLPRQQKHQGLVLLRTSDVVTTEAHALLLQMLGPPPTFAPRPAPRGLSTRQLAWVRLAPQLGALMREVYRDAHVATLFAELHPDWTRAQPTHAEVLRDVRLLDTTFGRAALPQETVQLLVVPLMAKDTGATLMLGRRGAITLVGPVAGETARKTLVVHEMLHPRIARLIAEHPSLAAAIDASACLRQAAQNAGGERAVSQVYDGWRDYFVESWVRGLARTLTHGTEADDGFALARTLGELPTSGGADALAAKAESTLRALTARLCPAPA